jgi:ribosomal protein L24
VRGDLVQVIQGPQTGQQGKILEVIRKSNRVIIDGVNLVRNSFPSFFKSDVYLM